MCFFKLLFLAISYFFPNSNEASTALELAIIFPLKSEQASLNSGSVLQIRSNSFIHAKLGYVNPISHLLFF